MRGWHRCATTHPQRSPAERADDETRSEMEEEAREDVTQSKSEVHRQSQFPHGPQLHHVVKDRVKLPQFSLLLRPHHIKSKSLEAHFTCSHWKSATLLSTSMTQYLLGKQQRFRGSHAGSLILRTSPQNDRRGSIDFPILFAIYDTTLGQRAPPMWCLCLPITGSPVGRVKEQRLRSRRVHVRR